MYVSIYIRKAKKKVLQPNISIGRPSSTKEKTYTKKGLGKIYDSQVSSDHFVYNFGPKVTGII